MFLPSGLAYRFLHEYTKVLHALFPVLDLADVNRSIDASFGTPGPTPLRPFPDTDRAPTERARDLLVLAFGAQVIGGDGDAQCPRDVAIVWSETLRRAAYTIMQELDVFEGGVDLIRLWIIYAEFGRNYGNSGGESRAEHVLRVGARADRRRTRLVQPNWRPPTRPLDRSVEWGCTSEGPTNSNLHRRTTIVRSLPSVFIRKSGLACAMASHRPWSGDPMRKRLQLDWTRRVWFHCDLVGRASLLTSSSTKSDHLRARVSRPWSPWHDWRIKCRACSTI